MSKGLFLLLLLSLLLWCCEKHLWKNTFTYVLSYYLLQRNVWPLSVFISSYESIPVCAVIVFMMDPIHEMECGISATYSRMSHSFIIVPFLLKGNTFVCKWLLCGGLHGCCVWESIELCSLCFCTEPVPIFHPLGPRTRIWVVRLVPRHFTDWVISVAEKITCKFYTYNLPSSNTFF